MARLLRSGRPLRTGMTALGQGRHCAILSLREERLV